MSQHVQPARRTGLIVTEILNKEHPEKPAVVENPASGVQMMAKDGFDDQKMCLKEPEADCSIGSKAK